MERDENAAPDGRSPEGRSPEGRSTKGSPRGAANRVVEAHRQVRWTLPAIGLFAVAGVAAVAADERWVTLHLVLAGATILLISAVSLMLTITWSAAPAPSDLLVALQRTCVAVGVAVLVGGRRLDAPTWVPFAGALLYAVGLVGLAALLIVTISRGVERRFDLAVAGYVAAVAAGLVGAWLGASMVIGEVSPDVRDAHLLVNLLGLIGLVAFATLPFFLATVVRSKMSPRARPPVLAALLVWQVIALAVAVGGHLGGSEVASAVGLGAYALGIVVVAFHLPAPTQRQFTWAGPRLVAMWLGTLWWAVVAAVAAVSTFTDGQVMPERWISALVVAGYGQIVWGSLAYLLPVIRGGGHKKLSAGFNRTRSWPGLVAANVTGLALVAGLTYVATAMFVLWCGDAAVRYVSLGLRRHAPPGAATGDPA